jgi:hemoglobin
MALNWKLSMSILVLIAALTSGASTPALSTATEQPVAPYVQSDANAGTTPIPGDGVYRSLHERAGIDRIVVDMIARCQRDPRIADIFKGTDLVRLHRTLVEQLCYISGGPCHYSGRDMATAHKDMGLQNHDFNALVEDLQAAMDQEGVPFRDQNRLLAKLAPMQRVTVDRPPKL